MIADFSITVGVVVLEEYLKLDLGWEEAKLAETLFELLGVEGVVLVGVQLPEDSADSAGVELATLGEHHSEVVVDLVYLDLKANSKKMRHMRFN